MNDLGVAMTINIALIYVLPVILLLWLGWRPMNNVLGRVFQILALLTLTLAITLSRAWIPIPIGWTAALLLLSVVVAIRGGRTWPELRVPQSAFGWLAAAVLAIIIAFGLWISVISYTTGYWHQAMDMELM